MNALTIKQVAERMQVAQATVYQLCASRKLGHFRVGTGRGTIRIDEEDLAAYLNAVTVQPDEPAAPSPRQPREKLKHLKL